MKKDTNFKKKPIILGTGILMIVLSGYLMYQSQTDSKQPVPIKNSSSSPQMSNSFDSEISIPAPPDTPIINLEQQNNNKDTKQAKNKIIKLLPPKNNQIYFGAFPDFGGPENNVSARRIKSFETLANKKIAWAYFSQNWFNGITYPRKAIHEIIQAGTIPFVRLMPRSDEKQFHKEKKFSLRNIVNGKFDKELRQWAQEATKDFEKTQTPLLIDFAVEMNGDWFPWSGALNDAGRLDGYGDPTYPDGPELYRDAYRHIIDIFREENVTHITWFFHPDIYSGPKAVWNQAKYYYPGDNYIDWIGFSIYGPQNTGENYWETFSEILDARYQSILDISSHKPVAILEFGVTDAHPLGNKDEWLEDAFQTILNNPHIDFKAISYWHENWEEGDGVWAKIRIDSSAKSLATFKKHTLNNRFVSNLLFSNQIRNKSDHHTKDKKVVANIPSINKEKDQKAAPHSWYQPRPGITWQWQLTGQLNLGYAVDLYDLDLETTSKHDIKNLHNKGAKVICYFNGGAYESYRTDAKQFPKEVLGKAMEGWEDEKWLDISNYKKFTNIMTKRLDQAVEKKCDGVEPDNVQGYQEDTGFYLTYNDQLTYNKWLADEAHQRNLSIALKNDLEQINDLVNYFDFAINEQCFEYEECDKLLPFIRQNKAVLGVEYELETSEFCEKANQMKFSWLQMDYDLDGGRISCSK